MSSPFEFGVGALLGSLHAIAAGPAVYRGTRNDVAKSLEINVAWGETDAIEFTENAGGLRIERRDAIIRDWSPLTKRFGQPQPGDTIEQDGLTFEVMPMGDEPCYRWSGKRHALRIHTKLVEE